MGSLKRSSVTEPQMPTIPESISKRMSWTDRNIPSVQRVLDTIKNAPNRLSQSFANNRENIDEENINLTENVLD